MGTDQLILMTITQLCHLSVAEGLDGIALHVCDFPGTDSQHTLSRDSANIAVFCYFKTNSSESIPKEHPEVYVFPVMVIKPQSLAHLTKYSVPNLQS